MRSGSVRNSDTRPPKLALRNRLPPHQQRHSLSLHKSERQRGPHLTSRCFAAASRRKLTHPWSGPLLNQFHFDCHLGSAFPTVFISTSKPVTIGKTQYPVEALNLNESQSLTRPGPRLFSPALRAFLARQNNRVLRRSASLRPLTAFKAGHLCPPFGRLGVNRALGSRDINIWR